MNAATKTDMRHRCRGQAALEYILVFVALMLAASAAVYFVRAPGEVAKHDIDVICSDRY